jgi:uncharacterized protein YgiM (DUF1202 family)
MTMAGVFAGALACCSGGQALLTEMRVDAGERGVILSLIADQPFDADFILSENTHHRPELEVRMPATVYGLSDYSYESFGDNSPLASIEASQTAKGVLVIRCALRCTPMNTLRSKQKENTWMVLISAESRPHFAWETAARAEKPAAMQPARLDAAEKVYGARLTDIRIMQRSEVEELIAEVDAPVHIVSELRGRRITAVFENVISDVDQGSLTPSIETAFRDISLEQHRRGDVLVTVLSCRFEAGRPIVRIEDRTLRMYIASERKKSRGVWSAKNGAQTTPAVEQPARSIDYQRIQRQARADLSSAPASGSTFRVAATVGGPPAGKPQEPRLAGRDHPQTVEEYEASPPESERAFTASAPRRVVIVKERVNIRSTPTTDEYDNIIKQLSAGALGTELETRGRWRRIQTEDDIVGWVYETLIMDSASVSEQLWKTFARGGVRKSQERIEEATASDVRQIGRAPEIPKGARDARIDTPPPGHHRPPNGKKMIVYTVYGRDPFVPLDPESLERSEFPDVEQMTLVGVMYDQADRIALVEDQANREIAYALREGDRVDNGRVLKIQPRKVLFLLTEMGVSRTFSLSFKEKSSE